jgi:hypothetical protein
MPPVTENRPERGARMSGEKARAIVGSFNILCPRPILAQLTISDPYHEKGTHLE